MSSSVTPIRRRRSEDEEEISVDGGASPSASKRPRTERDTSPSDQGSQSGHGPVLPDNYRRTPHTYTPQDHQIGSIIRVTLKNFVTYTNAEFNPGPSLNMIIGANGTGKSTLVCAICIGLGYSANNLGRAKENGEFVKTGTKAGSIEIELKGDPERHRGNVVIGTQIKREGNQTTFTVDGKKTTKKAVSEVVRSFSIQVDNLCQFLPQDRVVEFAQLSPVDRLVHTQRAAAPEYMSEWHAQLKRMSTDVKSTQQNKESVAEALNNFEGRQRLQETDVQQMRERSELQERLTQYKKMRPFPVYRAAKERFETARKRQKEAAKELGVLERNMEPNLRVVNEKKDYLERVDKGVGMRKRLVERGEKASGELVKKQEDLGQAVKDREAEDEAEKNSIKKQKQSLPGIQRQITSIQKALENPPEEPDTASMNEETREKTRLIREIEEKGRENKDKFNELSTQKQQRQEIINQAEREKENMQSQAGQQANKLRQASRDSARAWEWIQANRSRFQGNVFGPPMIECSVKDQRHADAVESMIPPADMLSFTVTTREDFKMLQQQLYGSMRLTDINLRNAPPDPLSSYRPPVPAERLQEYGLTAWLMDLIEGPEQVLAMLCDNRNIHQTAFAARELSNAQFEALKSSPVSSWVTPSQTYNITRRREYGDKATSTRVQPIKRARFFTDTPVDRQQEDHINSQIREAECEIEEINSEIAILKAEGEENGKKRTQLQTESQEIGDAKARMQTAVAEFGKLPTRLADLEGKQERVADAIKESRKRQLATYDTVDQLHLQRGQVAIDYANSLGALHSMHLSLCEAEILRIEGKSEVETLEARAADDIRQLQERKAEVRQLEITAAEAKKAAQEALDQCKKVLQERTEEEQEMMDELPSQQTSEELETEIESVEARLGMTHNGDPNIIREYEDRAKRIERQQGKLEQLERDLEGLKKKIEEVRGKWEPELDKLIGEISEAFGENFSRINCAGEVVVHKDEDDFGEWAVQIKVKFREQEQLSLLDAHRQSGGERAVSTIFYLMALQSLARAPFRVVDEINQGMDPRNERLVHSRMVDIACEEHTSQYFLITPKLLSGLKYREGMKVHCIASGEYMPPVGEREGPEVGALDFGRLARRALALHRGPSAVAAG